MAMLQTEQGVPTLWKRWQNDITVCYGCTTVHRDCPSGKQQKWIEKYHWPQWPTCVTN